MWEQLRAALRHVDREWDLLYLGRCAPRSDHCDLSQYTRTGERVSACLVVPGFSYCTYGYVLSARGLQRVLGECLPLSRLCVHVRLRSRMVDHIPSNSNHDPPSCPSLGVEAMMHAG